MHCLIRCICSTFLCCVLLHVCSKRLHKRMQIHIGCICLNLTHCAFANVLSKHIHKNILNYTRCICLTFLDCALPFVLLNVWEYEDELEKSQHNIVILSVESYSCHSYHHCHCHHNSHRCCHRHRHLYCHQYKHCCVIFIEVGILHWFLSGTWRINGSQGPILCTPGTALEELRTRPTMHRKHLMECSTGSSRWKTLIQMNDDMEKWKF